MENDAVGSMRTWAATIGLLGIWAMGLAACREDEPPPTFNRNLGEADGELLLPPAPPAVDESILANQSRRTVTPPVAPPTGAPGEAVPPADAGDDGTAGEADASGPDTPPANEGNQAEPPGGPP